MVTRRSIVIIIISLIAFVSIINTNTYLIESTATLKAEKEEEKHEPLHASVVTKVNNPTTESAPRPHPLLPYPSAILDIIKSTNSSQYTWIGNQYVPPAGVPVFTPSQIKAYFQNRNVLFIGDSTSKRIWRTMKNIINAQDLDNIAVEDVHVDQKNWTDKNGMTCENTGPRSLLLTNPKMISCANTKGSTAENYVSSSNLDVDSTTSSGQIASMRMQRKGLIDNFLAYCHHNIQWLINGENPKNILEELKEDYDLVIIGNGIWEYVNSGACRRKSLSGLGLLPLLLDTIRDVSSKDLQIVVRSPGFAQDSWGRSRGNYELMGEFVDYSLQYFHNLTMAKKDNVGGPKPNITLVDFGSVIYKRSFNAERIEGDHVAHYGYEARTLLVQQLMHELIKAELEN